MSSDSNNDGLSESEIIKLLFKNYMNFTTTSHNKLFYEETQLSNNNNIFSSGVLTNSPPVDTPNFTDNVVQTASELSQYLSYAALPNINIDKDWFNSKRTIGLTDSSGVFSVDSTDDTERTVLRLETIKLDYLGGTSAAFVCNDNSGVNILQNLVPPNYATNGYSTRLWYLNNNNILAEIGWLASRSTLGTGTYVGHDVSFGGALFDSKNGVITFYDVLNDDPAAVFSEVSCNFYLTATKYIGSTLADGGVGGSGPVNPAGQTFHEVVTGAPQTFTMGDISSTLFTIDISWDFADIQLTESNNSMFNFPGDVRNRVIPYIGKIWFDISSSTPGDIDFSANIPIDSNHNYAEDSKEVNGNIPSNNYEDLSYNLTYRTITLIKYSEDTRRYTVNVWGENESKEKDLYKLTFPDISFVPDSGAVPVSLDYIMNTYETISGDLLSGDSDYSAITDSDGNIVRFMIDNSGSFGTFAWKYPLDTNSDGVSNTYNYSSDGKWTFSGEISGNTTITIKTWTDFYTKVDGQGISAEFYDDSDVSGFTSTIDINIFVDAEANFNPTPNTSDTSGISQTDSEPVYGIVYAVDSDGDISFSVVTSFGGTDNSLNILTDYGASAEILSQSDVSAEWKYTPVQDWSGNDTFFIRTTDTSGGFTDISINIFVDAEANFNPTINTAVHTSDTSGISQTGNEVVSGIVYAADTDGDISFSVVSSFGGTDNSLNILTSFGASAEILSQSDVSAEWKYTPDSDFSGNDTFFIRTTDTSGGFTDISINIFVDAEASSSHDPIKETSADGSSVFIGDINETITGRVDASDTDGDISFSISNPPQDGNAYILYQTDSYVDWEYTPNTDFSGNDTFTIQTLDTSGGTTDIDIKVIVSVFYQIAFDLSSKMKSVHSGLLPLGGSSTGQVQNYNGNGYNWFVYKVDESETSTEYLPSENSSTGTAGINLSRIMETQFGDSSENAFSNSLYNTASNDILVYIVATRKLTDDHYMARISNFSQGPGFDEMNPWYWNNKVTESSLSSLTSGSGSGALPSTSLQAEIRNNDNASTVFATSNDSDIAIYTHSNVLQDHYFYFAFKN